jgi:hypothetical protein
MATLLRRSIRSSKVPQAASSLRPGHRSRRQNSRSSERPARTRLCRPSPVGHPALVVTPSKPSKTISGWCPSPGKRCMKELILPPPSRVLTDDHPLAKHRREEPGQGVTHRVVHRSLQAEAAWGHEIQWRPSKPMGCNAPVEDAHVRQCSGGGQTLAGGPVGQWLAQWGNLRGAGTRRYREWRRKQALAGCGAATSWARGVCWRRVGVPGPRRRHPGTDRGTPVGIDYR